MAPTGVIGGMGDDLTQVLVEGYGRAYRTAYLIVREPADAEEAVQEAFLRVWRFRDALPSGDGIHPWIYRVLVNTCYSTLRREVPRRERTAATDDLDRVPAAGASPQLAGDHPRRARRRDPHRVRRPWPGRGVGRGPPALR